MPLSKVLVRRSDLGSPRKIEQVDMVTVSIRLSVSLPSVVYRLLRSTCVPISPVPLAPSMVSASQSPKRPGSGAAGGGEFDAGGGQAGDVEAGVVVDHVDVTVAVEVGDLGLVTGGAAVEVGAAEAVVDAVDAAVAVEVGEVPAVAVGLPLAVGGVLVAFDERPRLADQAHDVVVGVVEGVEQPVTA